MRYGIVTAVATISFIAAFIYGRSDALMTFYKNAPERFQTVQNASNLRREFFGFIRNCEDVYLNDQEGWALLSCDPGRDTWNTVMGTFIDPSAPLWSPLEGKNNAVGIYFLNYIWPIDRGSTSWVKLLDWNADETDFHPLGIDYVPETHTLFVVNHAFSGSRLEVFKLHVAERAATHVRTIQHPLLLTPNSVAAINGRELIVTNDHYFRRRFHPILAVLETYLGFPGGTIVHVKLSENLELESVKAVARLPFANGVAFLNSTTLAVASSNTVSVQLYSVQWYRIGHGAEARLKLDPIYSIKLPFAPDNLSVDSNGKLLIAGHPHAPSLEKVAKNNRHCGIMQTVRNDTTKKWCKENLPGLSWVAEWSEMGGLNTLYAGKEFGSSTTAVRDAKLEIGIITGLYEEGIFVFSNGELHDPR